jgi:uncharacterized small protein (DUF1192 family)
MGLIDVARDTLKEIPMADILRERLSLALGQFAAVEKKVGELQTEIGRLQGEVERYKADLHGTQKELGELKKEHEEETIVHSFIDWKRGKRTQNKWMPFCPTCRAPAGVQSFNALSFAFCTGECSKRGHPRIANLPNGTTLESVLAQLPA